MWHVTKMGAMKQRNEQMSTILLQVTRCSGMDRIWLVQYVHISARPYTYIAEWKYLYGIPFRRLVLILCRINALAALCAEITARCNDLSAEWLGVLRTLCCSTCTSNFNDVLLCVEASPFAFAKVICQDNVSKWSCVPRSWFCGYTLYLTNQKKDQLHSCNVGYAGQDLTHYITTLNVRTSCWCSRF